MFISVKEAADLTGKSATTIYRLCNKRINTEFVRKEDNKFLIDKEYLMATYPLEEEAELMIDVEEQPEMRFENVMETENVKNDTSEKTCRSGNKSACFKR
ncbi:MAG: helix-turn-helix domain-containing protein [Chloroflexia bacterium]|nr:helix-turn-helix domain-containing protein [Chloroflexia bacterium]